MAQIESFLPEKKKINLEPSLSSSTGDRLTVNLMLLLLLCLRFQVAPYERPALSKGYLFPQSKKQAPTCRHNC